jgi:hypothetical protein
MFGKIVRYNIERRMMQTTWVEITSVISVKKDV